MDTSEFCQRYAAVVVEVGLNLQPGQELYIRAPIEARELVPDLARAAYLREAKYVHVEYQDQAVLRSRIEAAPTDSLTFIPPGNIGERLRVARNGDASLAILGEDPMGLAGIDPERRAPIIKAAAEATSELRRLGMKDHYNWCVVSMPNPAWSRRVYPDLPEDEGLSRLFDSVAHACRLDTDDPVAQWRSHALRLTRLAAWLTHQAFDRFEYRAPGTELVLGMPKGQHWIGTDGDSSKGISFIANIPTDEVFCAPDWRRGDGTVRSTRPLVLGGTNLGIAELVLEGGKIVSATCERDQAILDQELDLDDRSRYLGEIALVAEDSPIAELKTTFYDGLYDENAGCHLAFGNSYAHCVNGAGEFSDEQRMEAGLNVSRQHADFTVGSGELSITAVGTGGERLALMEGGRWTPEVLRAAGV